MNNNLKYILIAVAVLVLGATLFMFLGGGESAMVSLEASLDKESYSTDEEITISAKLSNTGTVDTCISDRVGGSIVFNSITRDGVDVATRSVPGDYIEAFPKLLEVSLTPVAPGESLQLTLPSENDPGLGARALSTTTLEDDTGVITFYNVEDPGTYEIELTYQYTGPESPECDNVFEGPSNSANITFTVNE